MVNALESKFKLQNASICAFSRLTLQKHTQFNKGQTLQIALSIIVTIHSYFQTLKPKNNLNST